MKAMYVASLLLFALICAAQQQPDQSSSLPMQVSPDEAVEHLQATVAPEYPELGIAARIQNNELLKIVIDEQGQVIDAKVQSGHPAFGQPSLDAVKQWKYRPFLLNGQPVRVETKVYLLYRVFQENGIRPPLPNAPASLTLIVKPGDAAGELWRIMFTPETLEGRRLNYIEPKYPEMARIAHIQGDVLLDALIDKEGHVASLRAIKGHPILVQAALDAVKEWTYTPFLLNGEPVAVQTTVEVRFHFAEETSKQ
jgi:TonB family protein